MDKRTVFSSPEVKYLDVIFDYKLSFKQHVKGVRKKCSASINILKILCGTWLGADPDTLIILYKSYVRSVLEYCIFAWFPLTEKLRENLQRMQNSAIRAAMGYRNTTPINVMHAESAVVPLKFRARYLGDRFFAKVLSNRNLATRLNTLTYYFIMAKSPGVT